MTIGHRTFDLLFRSADISLWRVTLVQEESPRLQSWEVVSLSTAPIVIVADDTILYAPSKK